MPEVQGQPGHRLLGSLLVLESTQHLQVRDGGEQYKYDEVCLSPTSDRESVDTEVGMCKALRSNSTKAPVIDSATTEGYLLCTRCLNGPVLGEEDLKAINHFVTQSY